jgi:2-dehydropantoate 2-reductase
VRVVIFGAGAVGCSVCGWVGSAYEGIRLLARGKNAEAIRSNGITLYKGGEPNAKTNVRVNVIADLSKIPDADVVVLAVKNYSLDAVAKAVREALGDKPIVVGLQNGVENQAILPRHFTRVVYGIVGYNAWVDAPGVVGYQKRGPLVLGTLDNGLQSEMASVAEVLNLGLETVITPRFQDAAHSKLILNLSNSLTTLIGHGFQEVSSVSLLQRVLSNLILEGMQIVKTAGHREWRIGGMPSWAIITASAKLPQFLTRAIFKANLKKMVMSSMAQDVRKGDRETEIESINGYIIRLADKLGLQAPYNRAIYQICREEFGKPSFKPLDIRNVWTRINEQKGRA